MAHCGSLKSQDVSDDVRDIRGTTVRGSDGRKLGKVDDVIFDHDTMSIQYLVVDSEGWLEAGTFLLPADRVGTDPTHEDDLAAQVTRKQVENSPRYEDKSLDSDRDGKRYEQEFRKYWHEAPVMHINGSDRIITPPEEPTPIQASSRTENRETSDRQLNAAQLFPERMTEVFSDPAPSAGKVTLRPKSAARAEKAASGTTLLKPHWWEAFENYLRENKSDIRANCSQCESKAA